MIEYRWGRPDDRAAIECLWQQCFEPAGHPWYRWYFPGVCRWENVWLATEGQTVVGMAHCHEQTVHWRGCPVSGCLIMGVAVDRAHRQRGIMPGMLAGLGDAAGQRGWELLRLTAQRPIIYQRLGWHPWLWLADYDWTTDEWQKLPGKSRATPVDWERADQSWLAAVYREMCHPFEGWRYRSDADWQRRMDEWQSTGCRLYALGDGQGYAVVEDGEAGEMIVAEYAWPDLLLAAVGGLVAHCHPGQRLTVSLPAAAISRNHLPHRRLAPRVRPWMFALPVAGGSGDGLKLMAAVDDNIMRMANWDFSP
ncbi:MAG: GNAT family N-acetyltransferase [Negativicutes bacterium]|nr:GNAT family N-acetyltransferase [Negativicutes bacterium]